MNGVLSFCFAGGPGFLVVGKFDDDFVFDAYGLEAEVLMLSAGYFDKCTAFIG